MSKILLLTPIYPSPDKKQKGTPVVHYFAKEWVKQGHQVVVCHYPANFPVILRFMAKPILKILESKCSDYITVDYIDRKDFIYENVNVYRIPLKKYRPHTRPSKKQINKVVTATSDICTSINFTPDIIIGHWVNPQIDIMAELKKYFNVPTCLVMHGGGGDIKSLYKDKTENVIKNIDAFGFRSKALKEHFENLYGQVAKSFYCYSGVPKAFCDGIQTRDRNFEKVHSFVFVGMLIQRKYPFETLKALYSSDFDEFSMKFIGDGAEGEKIKSFLSSNTGRSRCRTELLGRIPREEIKHHLLESDIFIMISKNEVFGLVYLEAMATGCIPIASRNEGFDGIIKDGFNGFLCEAGNEEELTRILNKIRLMPPIELQQISQNAIATANNMTDDKVAKRYITDVESLLL